jgi:hypothetical protein
MAPSEAARTVRRRPEIVLRAGETERAVGEIESGLLEVNRGLYRRGGLIVSTGVDRMQTWDGKAIEIPIIEEIGDYALLEQSEAVMDFVRFDKKKTAKRVDFRRDLTREFH